MMSYTKPEPEVMSLAVASAAGRGLVPCVTRTQLGFSVTDTLALVRILRSSDFNESSSSVHE